MIEELEEGDDEEEILEEDWVQFYTKHHAREEAHRLFAAADANGDGVLSKREIKKFFAKNHHARVSPHPVSSHPPSSTTLVCHVCVCVFVCMCLCVCDA